MKNLILGIVLFTSPHAFADAIVSNEVCFEQYVVAPGGYNKYAYEYTEDSERCHYVRGDFLRLSIERAIRNFQPEKVQEQIYLESLPLKVEKKMQITNQDKVIIFKILQNSTKEIENQESVDNSGSGSRDLRNELFQ